MQRRGGGGGGLFRHRAHGTGRGSHRLGAGLTSHGRRPWPPWRWRRHRGSIISGGGCGGSLLGVWRWLGGFGCGSLRDGRVRAALAITTCGCAAALLPLRLNRLLQAWASLRNHSCSGFWTRKGSDLFLGAMSGPLALRQLSHVPAMALGRVLVRAPARAGLRSRCHARIRVVRSAWGAWAAPE